MFNQIAIRLLEEATGKTWPSFMEDATGVSAKTWKKGGPQSPAVIERARIDAHAKVFQNLRDNGGYSYDEAVAISRQIDWSDCGLWLLLVRWGIPPGNRHRCPETETLARRLDSLAAQLDELRRTDDLSGYRQALLESSFLDSSGDWQRLFNNTTETALREIQATSWESLNPLIGATLSVAVVRLMACWDVEFHSRYLNDELTGQGLAPRPLFELVLPALKPGAKLNAKGEYASHGLFRLPLRRMLNVAYCLATYHRTRCWPSKREVTRTRVAAAGGEILQGASGSEQPLAKIHKGSRGLTAAEFADVWHSMCGHIDNAESPLPPWPIYFAAQCWTILFVRQGHTKKQPGAVEVTVHDDALYRHWWNIYLSAFKARGTKFGSTPWPDYTATA